MGAYFPQGQGKLSVITRCPYKQGVRKAGFDQLLSGLLLGVKIWTSRCLCSIGLFFQCACIVYRDVIERLES